MHTLVDSTVQAAIADHEEAGMTNIEALYKQYSPDVFRFALYLSGNRDDAADITSETFVRAWTTPDRINVSTVKAYLFTIARNLFLQEMRKKPRRAELSDEMRDPLPNPARQAEDRSELDAVLAELRQLPELDRTALLMRALEEIPYEEIASALNISVTTAKVKVHRARLLLSRRRML